MENSGGYGQAFAPSIYWFLLFRCLLGIVAYGRFSVGLLLIMEIVGPKRRAALSVFVEFSYYFGHFILIAFFYYLPDYRYVQITVSTIQIAVLFFFHLVPESIRWNIVNGRYDEAKQELRTAALMKYDQVDPVALDGRIDKLIGHFENEEKKAKGKKKQSIFDLWAIPSMLKISLILYLCWFTNHMIGYSTAFNATNFGSLYVSMTALTTANLFATLLLFLIIERFNRKTVIIPFYGCIIITCICLAMSFNGEHGAKAVYFNETGVSNSNSATEALNAFQSKYGIDLRNVPTAASRIVKPKYEGSLRLWLGMVLKMAVSICFHSVYVLAVESFPTVIRQLSVGTCSLSSRFATVLSPFTKELVSVSFRHNWKQMKIHYRDHNIHLPFLAFLLV